MNTLPSQPTDQSQEDDGSELNILDLLTQLLARKWIIVATVFIGVLAGAFKGQLPPDQYKATSTIHIERRAQGIQLPTELVGQGFGSGNSGSGMDTETHIIKSRLILRPVVTELNLGWQVKPERFPVIGHMAERRNIPGLPSWFMPQYIRRGDVLKLGMLEVDDTLINRKVRIEVLKDGAFQAQWRDEDPIIGTVGDVIQIRPGYRFRIAKLQADPGRVFNIWQENPLTSIARLRGGLGVRERGRSAVVDFSFTSRDRHLTKSVINTIVQSYQTQTLNRRSAEINQSISFIEDQIPHTRLEVAKASEALSAFRQKHNVTELAVGAQELLQRAVGLEAELEELRFKEDDLSQRLTPNHPEYQDLLQRRERLETRLTELRSEAATLPPLEQELLTLTEALERALELERQLVNRSEQLNIVRASTVGNIRVLEPAETVRRISLDRTNPALIGGALGLLLGIFSILGLNFLRRGIDDSRTIEQLGLPVFATVSSIPELRGPRPKDEFYAIAKHAPSHLITESFRGLRTGLQFSLATAPKRSLMITSPAPSMGKSFISLNLAIVSAQSGMRTLLIDADLRKGILRKRFNLPKKHPGLSDFLSERAKLDDVIYKDPETGIDFIGTGAYPPNPADMLTSDTFAKLMDEAPQHYDLVLVDSPPVLAVTDPNIIGQHVGLSLLIVKHLSSTKAEVQAAQKMLESTGVHLSGAILNQFDSSASRYGHYGQKYGYYGGYSYKYD